MEAVPYDRHLQIPKDDFKQLFNSQPGIRDKGRSYFVAQVF
jgi:hypothetical protein